MNIQSPFLITKPDLISSSDPEYRQLETCALSHIFDEAKQLIKSFSNTKKLGSDSNPSKKRLIFLANFSLHSLKSKAKLENKKFVGYFSLLSFVFTSAPQQQDSLNFHSSFYRNFAKYTNRLIQEFKTLDNGLNSGEKKKILNIYLYSLSSLCKSSSHSEKFKKFQLNKLFSLPVIKSFLSLQLDDDEKVMKYYRIILVYIYENKPKGLPTEQLLKSLIFHLKNCSSNSNTQSAIMFIFNSLLKNKKNSLPNNSEEDILILLERLRDIVVNVEDSTLLKLKLTLSLFSKLVQRNQKLSSKIIPGLTAIKLIKSVNDYELMNQNVYSMIMNVIKQMHDEQKLVIYKQYTSKRFTKFKNIQLQILEMITKSLNPKMLEQFLKDGFLKYLVIVDRTEPVIPGYQKYLINRILWNVIEESQHINRDVSIILKNLAGFEDSQDQY